MLFSLSTPITQSRSKEPPLQGEELAGSTPDTAITWLAHSCMAADHPVGRPDTTQTQHGQACPTISSLSEVGTPLWGSSTMKMMSGT